MEGAPTTAAEAEGTQTPPRSGELADALSDSLAVQMDEAAASSASRHPVQMVTSEETGAYKGYTLGGSKPTFYFEKGHLTQQHDNADNVGWHPNKSDRHFIKNITDEAASTYESNRSTWDRAAKTKFGLDVEAGKYDARPGEGSMVEGDVMTGRDGEEKAYLHPSRGRFINATEDDAAYTKQDADSAAAAASLANNAR
jgi:hypothetical protein